MAYYGYRREPSILENLTVSPLPFPVLFILLMVVFFMGVNWYLSYEDWLETAQVQLSFALLFTPLALILLIRFLPSPDYFDGTGISGFVYTSDRHLLRRRSLYQDDSAAGAASPWGVAAAVVLLLLLAALRSPFEDWWGLNLGKR